MLPAERKNLSFIVIEQDGSDGFRVEYPHENCFDEDVEDVVVGVQKSQVPAKSDETFIDEPSDPFLQSDPQQRKQGVHRSVALSHCLLVLVDYETRALRNVPDVFTLSNQVLFDACLVELGESQQRNAFVFLVYCALLGLLQQTNQKGIYGLTRLNRICATYIS